MSAIKGVKGIPNGSCILTLRDPPSTERGDAPRARRSPRPACCCSSIPLAPTGRAEPGRLFLCAAWRAAAHALRHRPSHEPGEKRRAPLLTGALSPTTPAARLGRQRHRLKASSRRLLNFTAPQPQPRRGGGFRESPYFPEPPLAPTAAQGRQVIQSARERPRRRDPLTETWPRFKA